MPATAVTSISRSASFTRSICSACILRPAGHWPRRVNKLRTKSVHDWRRYGVTETSRLHLNSSSNKRCLPSLALRQTSVVSVTARRRSFDDDYVEIDDEDRWGNQANRNLGMIPSLARPLLLAANSLGNKLTDLAIEFVPDSVDRSTVEIAVKAGLVLLAVAVARSLLGVALTLGSVLFGLYVAAKLWTKQDLPGQSSSQASRSGRKPRQQSRDDDGLSDVWFEDRSKRKKPKRPDDSFW